MSADLYQELQQRVRELERLALITVKPGPGRVPSHDYEVTIRRVGAEWRVILGPGQRMATGDAGPDVDANEQDLGVYTVDSVVYITWTHSTDNPAAPGAFGSWAYGVPPDETATLLVWRVATTEAGRQVHYHNVGMVRVLDVRQCVNCTP